MILTTGATQESWCVASAIAEQNYLFLVGQGAVDLLQQDGGEGNLTGLFWARLLSQVHQNPVGQSPLASSMGQSKETQLATLSIKAAL